MWVNKSVNPSQTSTRAAQAAPPRMTPGTVHAAGYATHTALRAELFRRNGPEGRFIAPAPRGSREAPGKASSTDYPWRPGASASRALRRKRPNRANAFLPFGLDPCRTLPGDRFANPRRCGAPCCAPAAPERYPALAGEREGTGPVKHGPVPWWGSIDACELPFLFSPSEPPPALGKSPVPVARQPAALSRHKRPPEKMDEHLFHVRRNPGLSHPCHVPFTGLGPFG